MSGPSATFADVRRFSELDSTNRHAMELARQGAAEGLVVVADHQTAGRGRLGRTWEAPPGSGLLVSVLLRPTIAPERLHLTTMAVALAAADACDDVAGVRPGLKWPNDLVVDDRKLGGILAEVPEAGAVVVGLGLNVLWETPPAQLADIGVALNQLVGRSVDREQLLAAILANLARRYAAVTRSPEELAADYRDECATIGRRVRVELPSETFHGLAVAVNEDGQLVVEDDGGSVRTVTAGDVIHVR